MFGDLADALAEAYPAVAPELAAADDEIGEADEPAPAADIEQVVAAEDVEDVPDEPDDAEDRPTA